ncbi:hypothetical protein QJQ45_008612 [Haematococcus lacustris]|nr:hypothetical protein QJQ45_008612 [Haematococcus lacustris]
MREAVLRLVDPAFTVEQQPGAYVQRLEAACHLLHRGIGQATGAQPSSSGPAAHKAASAAASPAPSAPGSISAGELCTLLLTDQEVLDVVLALHDIRAAQLCHLLSWPGLHALKLPPPSAALAQQLSQSQWSVPGSQLLSFVSALERDHDNSLKGDPLLRVWDSMHRAMLLVLAALQSLPIRPHPQHPDPAANTNTSNTTQLPPGYHRCSACLLLSLRLALSLAEHSVEQRLTKDLCLARLHTTLPGLLLGLSTSVTMMRAAGHPEAQAQRVQFVRCMLHLGPLVNCFVYGDITHFGQDVVAQLEDKVTTSCPDQLARLLASSPVVTGWPGPLPAKPSPLYSSTAEDSPGLGRKSGRCSSNRADPAAVNAYAHLAQALCAMLGRQEEELDITCQAEVLGKVLALAGLHATLPELLLGLSTAVTVMQAAGHPEAQAQRVQFVRCLLDLMLVIGAFSGDGKLAMGMDITPQSRESLSSCPWVSARGSQAVPVPASDFQQHVDGTKQELVATAFAVVREQRSRFLPPEHAKGLAVVYAHDWDKQPSDEDFLERQAIVKAWYCMEATLINGQWVPALLDHHKLSAQQSAFVDTTKLWRYLAGQPITKADISEYIKLAELALVMTPGSVEEERMFSAMAYLKDDTRNRLQECHLNKEVSNLAKSATYPLVREVYCIRYMLDLLIAVSAPSHPAAVATLGPSPPSPISSSLLSVILSVLPRSLVMSQACVIAVRLAVTTRSFTCPDSLPTRIRDFYIQLYATLQKMVQLWPDQRCRPAMLRVFARSAVTGAHAYMTLALLLDGAADHGSEPRSLPALTRTPELEQTFSHMVTCVCHIWILLLAPRKNNAPSGKEKVLYQRPSTQQLAPLALDLVRGMEGMLQMTQQHWRTFQTVVIKQIGTQTFSSFGACKTLLDLFGRVIEVLAEPAAVGPAALAAKPASWLPCGNSLVEGWCTRLLERVCQLLCITSPGLEGSLDHARLQGCQVLANSHVFLLQGRQQAPSSMSPEAERLLACLTLVLTVALPLDTWLAVAPSLPAAEVKVIEQASAIHDSLTSMEAEQVWSWQALAAGTPAEASLASVLQSAVNRLQLPHLVAPAPLGWQPGRLTLDRGRGPPELMRLCFPAI